MNRRLISTLVWTRKVGPNIFHQRFHQPQIARRSQAGQFVHILPASSHLFRRAFAVYATDPRQGTYDILYQTLGVGTTALAAEPNGCELDTLGPLGNCFTPPAKGFTPVLVGGGLGMASLRLWAFELAKTDVKKAPSHRPVMITGVRSESLVVAPYKLKNTGSKMHWASEDGSRGFRGTAVGLFEHMLRVGELDPARTSVYGCGPEKMMSGLASVCAAHSIVCEVSMERSMPCGYGVCMGCVVRSKNGSGYETHKRVCRDGPVFNAASIVF